jgi:hypothetical protein
MTWKELNWFKFEGNVFVDEFKGTFTTIFAVMQDKFQESRQHRDANIAAKKDNKYVGEELSWSEERLSTETQLLAAMIFTVAFRAIQAFLNEMLYWHTGQQSNIGKLHHLEDAYKKIGVVLSAQREFDIIKELRLVRNSCVHNVNRPDEEYQKEFPKPRWVNDSGTINITKTQWEELVGQIEHWANELVQRMTENRKRLTEEKMGKRRT